MNLKGICLGGLAMALCGTGVAFGQSPTAPTGGPIAPLGAVAAADATTGLTPANLSLSDWILYDRSPGCCGPLGRNGPIGMEVYFRSGISFPIPSGFLSDVLDTGWTIAGGGRTLFFNPEETSAWAIDVGIINMYFPSGDRGRSAKLLNVPSKTTNPVTGAVTNTNIPSVDVTVANLNQTLVNLSLGKEWYLTGCASPSTDHVNWRAGFDAGGRYGTTKIELDQLTHKDDAIGGLFVALHSDVEFPWGHCLLQAGLRTEYGYTWSDILQSQNNADVQYINLMATVGVRF